MKYTRPLLAISAGIVIYVLVSFFFGESGIGAYKFMETQKKVLTQSIESINQVTKSLELDIQALDNDWETIKLYAHELGYVQEGEHLIKLADYFEPGLSAFQRYEPGTPADIAKGDFLSDWACKLLGLFFGLFVFFMSKLNKKEKKEDFDNDFNF